MILCRTRMSRLGVSSLLVLSLLGLAGVLAAGSGPSKPAGSNARLRELMTQRYELLQVSVKNFELWLASGRVDIPTHQKLLDALYRAQADLGTTAADRIKAYEQLVEALTTQEKLAERQAEAGRLGGVEVAQVKLMTLNAQIDLERLRLGQSTLQP
jgi:hypothetical protein